MRKVLSGEDSIIYFGGSVDNRIVPQINFKNNSIKFRYSAASYEGKNINQFKTFLNGFDEDWSLWSTENTKAYTNLPPGKYTFNVAAENIVGVKSKIGSYSFEILPPWYRTWWAYSIYIIFLGFIVFIIDRVQRRRLITKERERAENERKSKELEEARKLQISMLPKNIPQIPHLDIAVFMQTATEVGGDYYDFSFRKDGALNICLGDATGHGMKAGILVTMMKSMFTVNSIDKTLEDFFFTSNNAIKNSKLGRMMIAFAMLHINSNKIRIANAGIPPVFIYRKVKADIEEINNYGLPIGAMKNSNYHIYESDVSTGDIILMLSDGLPELQNNEQEMYGYDRLKKVIIKNSDRSSEEIISYLKEEILRWANNKNPDDDVTFVVVKVK